MIHLCPHCNIILLDEEWRTGVCVCCHVPIPEAVVPAPSPPVEPPAPPKRIANVLIPCGAVLVLLAIGVGVSLQLSGSETPDDADEPEVAAVVAEPTDTAPEKKQSAETKTEKTKEPPKRTTNEPKTPETPLEDKRPPIDKQLAVAFALEITTAADLLAKKHFRELNEEQLILWAVRGLFDAAKENVPPALEKKLRKKSPEDWIDHLDLLVEARESLGVRKELAAPRDADLALAAMFRRLDPHTTLMDADAMTRLNLIQNGNRVGELGILVRRLPRGESVEVTTPFKDGPAYKAGIRAGDSIHRVRLLDGPDGRPLPVPEDIAPAMLAEEDTGRASWGPIGSRVEVAVRRPGSEQLQIHVLTRARVKKEKLLGVRRRADDAWNHVLDADRGIVYVRITDFHGPETAKELDQLLKSITQPKVKGLILDLRFSGGGLIQSAYDVADLFVPNGVIVEFRSRNLTDGKGRWMSRGKGIHAGLPIACLVNAEAGTCTEIVAAALQDHKKAVIVGERTSGKASAQNYFPAHRGTLRITTSRAHRPNGKALDRAVLPDEGFGREGQFVPSDATDEWGVTPDAGYVVPLAETERYAIREQLLKLPRLSRPDATADEPGRIRDRQLDRALESFR